MGVLDWLRAHGSRPPPAGMSRRDFFARVAGLRAGAPAGEPGEYATLHHFPVAAFPYHEGPALLPTLRPGTELQLRPEPKHIREPRIRVHSGRHMLGYVPPEKTAAIRDLMAAGTPLVCRVRSVDTTDAGQPLEVEIRCPQPGRVNSAP